MVSVGVERQHSGTASQVGVFLGDLIGTRIGAPPSELVPIGIPRWGPLADATSREQALLDRRRYLPQAWCNDPVRRARAKVPEEVSFPTKPELAIARLEPAWAQGERGRDR